MRWFVSKFLWSVLQCSFGINSAPIDVKSLFTTWLSPFDKGRHRQLCVGIYGLMWSI
uniref:Reverse transcriptase zinc-binding domain-containing protein n=1 Tax=Aegilops tauschii subsp. strangulata TaxID=200361 RepID=A0A453SNJ5_AEGTS